MTETQQQAGAVPVSVTGWLVFVPFGTVASMEYGAPGDDKAVVATVPGHLAGPFTVVQAVGEKPMVQPCGPVANEVRRQLSADAAEKLAVLRTRLEAFAEGLGRHHARGGRSAVAMAKLNMSHMIREILEES